MKKKKSLDHVFEKHIIKLTCFAEVQVLSFSFYMFKFLLF